MDKSLDSKNRKITGTGLDFLDRQSMILDVFNEKERGKIGGDALWEYMKKSENIFLMYANNKMLNVSPIWKAKDPGGYGWQTSKRILMENFIKAKMRDFYKQEEMSEKWIRMIH